jgi:hypothetical protein
MYFLLRIKSNYSRRTFGKCRRKMSRKEEARQEARLENIWSIDLAAPLIRKPENYGPIGYLKVGYFRLGRRW